MKKYCPLAFAGDAYSCAKVECLWWNSLDEECIVKSFAKILFHQERELKQINNNLQKINENNETLLKVI